MPRNLTVFLVAYIATFLPFVAMDMVWLFNTKDLLYTPYIGELLTTTPNLPAAVAFYLIYMAGVVTFGTLPGRNAQSFWVALRQGALFGLFAYATYDLTNQATLKTWSSVITIADMSWGTIVSGVAAGVGSLITRRAIG